MATSPPPDDDTALSQHESVERRALSMWREDARALLAIVLLGAAPLATYAVLGTGSPTEMGVGAVIAVLASVTLVRSNPASPAMRRRGDVDYRTSDGPHERSVEEEA